MEESLAELIAKGKVRQVATGFQFTEGPAYHAPTKSLFFSDIRSNRILRLRDGAENVETFLEDSKAANGLMVNAQGHLIVCQGGARRLAQLNVGTKKLEVLAETFEGKKLNSPNDLAIDAVGGIYFTDPRYGNEEGLEQPVMGVYYRSPKGALTRVIDDLPRPNGIRLSPAGDVLYVANPNRSQIVRYTVEGPGKLGKGSLFFQGEEQDARGPDGMAVDEQGNLYATYAKLVVLSKAGKVRGRIHVPEKPSNCAFGGVDGKTLFVTARTSLYALPMRVRGMGLPSAFESLEAVSAGSLTLWIPHSWNVQKPRSSMRLAQFEVPGAGGPGEFVVFYFGQGGAGGVKANAERWISQFAPVGRRSRLLQGTCAEGVYTLVECSGTYNQPVGPPMRRQTKPVKDSAMLAAFVPTKTGAHYLKFTGPSQTVEAAAQAFRASFGGNRKKEKEVALEDLR